MKVAHRTLVVVVFAVLLAFTGCGSSETSRASSDPGIVEPQSAVELIDGGATVIDVRTPEEYAAGHVDGALNIDVQSADFQDAVAELPKDDSYVVYCRTGSRAGVAAANMVDLGFTDVVNGGGLEALTDAGAPSG